MALNSIMKIQCYTLFDITQTNISNRRKSLTDDYIDNKERNQQSNLETLLQVIGLRTQPENITVPIVVETGKQYWGTKYKGNKFKTWSFSFVVQHRAIFELNNDKLGALKLDCGNVPMITSLDESIKLIKTLDYNEDYKNIHFEIVNE